MPNKTKHKHDDIPGENRLLPIMKPEEQRRLLNFIPGEYHPGASEELIKIIEESRTNNDVRENWANI